MHRKARMWMMKVSKKWKGKRAGMKKQWMALLIMAVTFSLLNPMAVSARVVEDVNSTEEIDQETADGTETDDVEGTYDADTDVESEETKLDADEGSGSEEVVSISESESASDTDRAGNAFSVSGNGQVLDDISEDGTKEFLTVTTENGNTYFLIIDRASDTDNVYLLSMVDEEDLEDFIVEEDASEEADSETVQSGVILDDTEDEAEADDTSVDEAEDSEPVDKESKGVNARGILLLILFGTLGVGGAYYYLRIAKPKQEKNDGESEGMEYSDGFETVNEDEDSGDTES